MSLITVYHGSQKIIEAPIFGQGKVWNDYGQGFYCTQNIELAKEWACPDENDGFANCYNIQTDELEVLNLQSENYTTLNWIALLIQNRKFDLETPIMRQADIYLKENFLLDVTPYDAIVGYRADDSYFSFAKAFLSNTISYRQLQLAMKLGNLGEQFVLKSQKAFSLLKFAGFELAEGSRYSMLRRRRNIEARGNFKKLLEEDDISGLFIRDIILQKVKNDDERLR